MLNNAFEGWVRGRDRLGEVYPQYVLSPCSRPQKYRLLQDLSAQHARGHG